LKRINTDSSLFFLHLCDVNSAFTHPAAITTITITLYHCFVSQNNSQIQTHNTLLSWRIYILKLLYKTAHFETLALKIMWEKTTFRILMN